MHKGKSKSLSTLGRFLYINTYAWLLFLLGIVVLICPLYRINRWLFIVQIVVSIFPFFFGCVILSHWNSRKREYDILMSKNEHEFTPSTFKLYLDAPCSRLLTRLVLKDLGKSSEFRNLTKLSDFYDSKCCERKTVVVFHTEQIKQE